MVNPPLLSYPDMNKDFILTTDASTKAIGFILSQKYSNGHEHIIGCGGRSLRGSEKNYGITDLESLAVVEGFKTYHTYIIDNKTTLITDHSALQFMNSTRNLTGRASRWAVALQGYNHVEKYRKKNENADALSGRNYPREPEGEETWPDNASVFQINAEDNLKTGQYTCINFEYETSPRSMPSITEINALDMATEQSNAKKLPHCIAILKKAKSLTIRN